MNRHALSLLALCAGLPALAQTPAKELSLGSDNLNVGVYATLDIGVGTTSHSLNFDPNLVCDTAPIVAFGKSRATSMISGGSPCPAGASREASRSPMTGRPSWFWSPGSS